MNDSGETDRVLVIDDDPGIRQLPSTNHQVQRGLDLMWAAQDRWSHFHHLKGDLPWLRSSTGWAPSVHDDNDQ
jgi:hypothetical protein